MKPEFLKMVFTLMIVPMTWPYAQECSTLPNAHLVTEYGTFTAISSDTATIRKNNTTINTAINQLGAAGGGVLCLPEGTFFIGPDPTKSDRAITINYNNITVCGAGIDKTILKTNGTWNATAKRRGHGIIITGTSNSATPRKNISLKNFELDGQAGWTGNYCWTPVETCGENEWDISHKGIVPSWDACCDSITLENLNVHHFRGEILYCGGMGMGRLVVRNVKLANTNGSDFNLYGADLLVERCTFDGPSRFWCELTARANQGGYPNNRAVFRNNVFRNAVGATAIVMCQGDYQPYSFTFDSNTISDCPGVFALYSGVKGPVSITNNTISNVNGNALEFGSAPGYINSNQNANVTFENNVVARAGCLANFSAIASNVMVRNNQFSGRTAGSNNGGTAVFYGAVDMHIITIENNSFVDCRTPEQTATISGRRPLFKSNTYQNNERRDQQGQFYITASSRKVTPHFEEVWINADVANLVPQLEDTGYTHGQYVKVTGGSTAKPVRFSVGQASFTVSQDRYLTGANTLWFCYDSTQFKWVESNAPAGIFHQKGYTSDNHVNNLELEVVGGRQIMFSVSIPNTHTRERVLLLLYDIHGRVVYNVADGFFNAGKHTFTIGNGQKVPAGLYLCRVTRGTSSRSVRIVVEREE